ncbi:MAG: tRNA(adenine34) deaminase [Alphaproteobacteria bacterium]|jgi:tRNA(adenine34) deaminase|nr:tRNA(adenine34) deaminase [Alphaproteobacteria bacterium]
MDRSAIDLTMMERCVELSAVAVGRRELPFACVIWRDGEVVAEAINRVVQDGDVTRHAEILAISQAQRVLGRSDLSDCTIYSNVEPCPMCSFPIRETRIGRVVFAISSPMMGGFSKWNVLGDNEISNVMPEVFGDKPEVAAGLHYREAAAVWRKWNPVFWLGIRFRGCFADPAKDDAYLTLQVRHSGRRPLRRLLAFVSQAIARKRSAAIAVRSDLRP